MRSAWLLLFVFACFRPSPPEGAPCALGMACPSPLVCDRGVCVREPRGVDAAADASSSCVPQWQNTTVTTTPAVLANINSTTADHNPFITADGQTLYFASDRDGMGLDIYRATGSGAMFDNPTVVADLSSPADDGGLMISPDGLVAVVASERAGIAAAGRNFWQATRSDSTDAFDNFSAAPFDNVNTDGNEFEVWLSNDLLRLYVSTSKGDQTIALATRASTSDVFPTPATIPELTSAATECCHSLSADELVIVFVSDRTGTNETYYATRAARAATFSPPRLVPGSGVQSGGADLHTFLTADACTLYLASTRSGGVGGYDIWVTTVAESP